MISSNSRPVSRHAIKINRADRWVVYYRLQELQIPCCCSANHPLQVEIVSPTTAIQLWSVLRQVSASRHELISWLSNCWDKESSVKE
jgi:hypothetical protein